MRGKAFTISVLCSITLAITSCYRPPIRQGNELTQQLVSGIKPGMPPYQVVSILGNPVLNNIFANNQLAYVYTYKKGTDPMISSHVIVHFTDNKVSSITTNVKQSHESQ